MEGEHGRGHPDRLTAIDRIPDRAMAVVVVLTLLGAWAVAGASQSEVSVGRHLFYVPIVVAALRFGPVIGGGIALVATAFAGPLAGAPDLGPAVARGAMFVAIAVLVGALASARDRRSRLEADVAERERALVAQRAALVQVVSHELRTPLTVLSGGVETLVERDVMVEPSGRQLVLAMERSVKRLQDMLEVLLAASDDLEVDAAALTDVDVGELVRHAAESLRPRLRHRLDLDIPPGASLTTVESHLWLTLRCLLDNADRFSPEDGVVRVSYECDGRTAVIAIADEGPGLPEGFSEAAFEPFRQADQSERREHGGLGMGLYTARRLARRLGGDVVLSSREDHGSLAEVRLPTGSNGGGHGANSSVAPPT